MMKFTRISGAAFAAAVFASDISAGPYDWAATPLAMEGWSAQEKGEPGDSGYSVKLAYNKDDLEFSIGCALGYALDIVWIPGQALEGGLFVPVIFSIDGEQLFERSVLNNDRQDYSWQDRGVGTEADKLVSGIWEKGAGMLTISGGGITNTIPFDEEKNEYWSEEILFACGMF